MNFINILNVVHCKKNIKKSNFFVIIYNFYLILKFKTNAVILDYIKNL